MNNSAYTERLAALNEKQQKAVNTIYGPVMVVAGPGTGKTELLALRVARLLQEPGVLPQNILCLTFTDTGAINMRERLLPLIGADSYRVQVFTFHAFASYIMSRSPEYFFGGFSFSNAGEVEKNELLQEIFDKLPHGHPFKSTFDGAYASAKSVIKRISLIKRAGYTAGTYTMLCERFLDEAEGVQHILVPLWPKRLSIKALGEIESIIAKLRDLNSTSGTLLAEELKRALHESEEMGATGPLGDFKKKYIKTEEGESLYIDIHRKDKIRATAELYTLYSQEMYARGLYDYDDMILEVKRVLEENDTLRTELEEEYQFIMIDEFQDTNDAQMAIVRAITSSDIHEGKPNICVVGDDDQGIYKFQGAELSNIIDFGSKRYNEVETVVLDKNYRSTGDVLSFARNIIIQGKERLENKNKEITKILSAQNTKLAKGAIQIAEFNDVGTECAFVAESIAKKIAEGVKPNEIAIITRKHASLISILPYLDHYGVPYEYEKSQNVFDEPHIRALIILCEYVSSLLSYGHTKDYLLPDILAFPFWNISREQVWKIAEIAKKENSSWIEAMKKAGKESEEIALFLQDIAVMSKYSPLEVVLDTLIGSQHVLSEKNEYTDDETLSTQAEDTQISYVSPFKKYYFDNLKARNEGRYIYFLTSLQTFIAALREYKQGQMLTVSDVENFIKIHEIYDIPLISKSPFVVKESSVQMLTAHKSKGLEFECVYIVSTSDKGWKNGHNTNSAYVPKVIENLFSQAGDEEDDIIRLFFVAITRAKHTLTITTHEPKIRFLAQDAFAQFVIQPEVTLPPNLILEKNVHSYTGLSVHEKTILKKFLERYKMSPTHLGNFMDITQGGPNYFVEQNLLRFPKAIQKDSAYGSAIHSAIEEFILYPKYNYGEKPTLSHILAVFHTQLSKARLMATDTVQMAERGEKVLSDFYDIADMYIHHTDKSEVNFADKGVILGTAQITGKIDILKNEDGALSVIDVKTGKASLSWEKAGDEYVKVKLYKYKLQLYFYVLLLRNTEEYKHIPIKKLSLLFIEHIHRGAIDELLLDVSEHELARVEKLITIVYEKIRNLDFPDIQAYPQTYEGILAFEKDLLGE